ncbi:TfoX/Sxy family protein [Clostridium sp. MB40-C1]|uniref:TfoX/Sxy family protein n=1 Tax=Clostridium sp. MB40-C1 TaxID=3070996 RepID=UPI0027E0DE70|nr:TfoX/Sxy family protein [Clostridium sp. MB40-C1]WMJ81659.1 TfoX/Sxy family protein [Clostridium sp. MB40-C1]
MASNIEFVEYVCDQISGAGNITYRKMFGDYGVYCNEKIIGLICDNQFFLKITKNGKELLHEAIEAPAYKGAKPSFLIESLDDREYLSEIVSVTYKELPMPKPKKKKIKNK